MFTERGSHDRLSCQQGTDLWIDMVCKLAPFFMSCNVSTGSCSQQIETSCEYLLFHFRMLCINCKQDRCTSFGGKIWVNGNVLGENL